jgi:hypothetical protein
MYKNRDTRINFIKNNPQRYCSGMGMGIILLDEISPAFPGDMRNPSAYPFPIQYEIAKGVNNNTLVFEADKSPIVEPIKQAAKKLERMGCKAIAAECGYFAYFQKDIAGYVNVPVFMSSLLQVSWAQQLIGPNKVVGILVAFENFMTTAHLEAVGIQPGSNYVIKGAHETGNSPFLMQQGGVAVNERTANYSDFEKQLLNVAVDFYQEHANMGVLLLECGIMQPFARAIQQVIDIPVFSWGTLLDYAYSIAVHRDFYGHV